MARKKKDTFDQMINELLEFKDFSTTVRLERKKKGLSAVKLANQLKVSPSAVSNIEIRYMIPSVKTIRRIAKILDLDENELLDLAQKQWLGQCAQSWTGKIERELTE